MNGDGPNNDSNVPVQSEWLGELPDGWRAIQLARIKDKLTNGFVGPTRDILRDTGVRYLQSLHIKDGSIVFNVPYYVSEEWSAAHGKSIVRTGDVLIVQTGDIGQVAAVPEEFAGCNCHALIIVTTKPAMVDGRFLSAVLRSHYGQHSLKSVQTGALHPHLNCTKIRDIYIPVPPLDIQGHILRFLDRESSKLDSLVDLRVRQIKLLKKQRASLVHQALSTGIDSAVEKKESGHPWLDDIPSHWEVVRLKFTTKINPPKSQSGHTALDSEEAVFLPMEAVGTDGSLDQSSRERISKLWSGFTYFARGDVLVAKITPCFENGKGALLSNLQTDVGFGTTEFHVLRAGKKVLNAFLYLNTISPRFRKIGQRFMTGAAGQQRIPEQFLSDFPLALPPLEEQREIVAYVVRESRRIDTLLQKYQDEIDLLDEYRIALISNAVTGKIDVRPTATPVLSEAAGVL